MVFNPLKLIPFFIIHKLSMRGRDSPQGILKIFDGWGCYNNDPTYKEHIVSIRELFYGQYMFTSEKYELEMKEEEYEKKLKCVKERLGKC